MTVIRLGLVSHAETPKVGVDHRHTFDLAVDAKAITPPRVRLSPQSFGRCFA